MLVSTLVGNHQKYSKFDSNRTGIRFGFWFLSHSLFLCVLLFSLTSQAQSQWFKTQDFQQNLPAVAEKNYVSLAFVGQDLVNAVSFFGHTFLVFHEYETIEPDAVVVEFVGENVSGVGQALLAGVSQIRGGFRLAHFLDKTREYQFESRDIWLYRLRLDEEERRRLIQNLLLFRKTQSIKTEKGSPLGHPYNFFTTNCAYYIAALVESAFDKNNNLRYVSYQDKQITLKPPSGYVMPLDTIRYFQKIDRVLDVSALPATYRPAQQTFQNLSKVEKRQFETIFDTQKIDKKEHLTADTASSLALTSRHLTLLTADPKRRAFLFQLLSAPLQIEKSLVTPAIDLSDDPAEVQKESLIRVGAGRYSVDKERVMRLSVEVTPALRSFYHPLLLGTETASLKVLSSQWSIDHVDKKNHLRLDQLNLWQVETFVPTSLWRSGVAQYFDISYYDWQSWRKLVEHKYQNAKEFVLRLGVGVSYDLTANTRFGASIYAGARHQNNGERVGFNKDIGVRWLYYQSFPFDWAKQTKTRLLLQQTYYYDRPFDFNRTNELGLVLFENARANVSLNNRWLGGLSSINETKQWQIALTYLF